MQKENSEENPNIWLSRKSPHLPCRESRHEHFPFHLFRTTPSLYSACHFYFKKCVLVPEAPKHGTNHEVTSFQGQWRYGNDQPRPIHQRQLQLMTKRMVFWRKFRMKKLTLMNEIQMKTLLRNELQDFRTQVKRVAAHHLQVRKLRENLPVGHEVIPVDFA